VYEQRKRSEENNSRWVWFRFVDESGRDPVDGTTLLETQQGCFGRSGSETTSFDAASSRAQFAINACGEQAVISALKNSSNSFAVWVEQNRIPHFLLLPSAYLSYCDVRRFGACQAGTLHNSVHLLPIK
jgi:hypothetical protein